MNSFQSQARPWLLASAASALLIAAGCNGPASQAPSGNGTDSAPSAKAEPSANSPSAVLRAAAEPFEVLTEQAFAAPWQEVDRLIADARTAAAGARGVLPAASASALDTGLAAVAAARQAEDRPALALAAVEIYRDLVQGQDPAAAQVPIPISLLDYAGFRYDALAQAPNVDWAAMEQAARFAEEQWRAVEPSTRSQALRGVMAQSIGAMAGAARERNVGFARAAAATELALVDLLEEYAAAQHRGSGG
jgi:hypothetical protein